MKKKYEKTADQLVDIFITYLKKEKMEKFLPYIAQMLVDKLKKEVLKHSLTATIISVLPLTQEQLDSIEQALTKKLQKPVIVKNVVDKTIIGGLIVRIGSLVIDQSVAGQLNKLHSKIYESQ